MEPQVMTNNKLNILSDTMFYDILAKKSYPLNNYRKHSEKDKLEVLNNNKELIKLESDMGNLEVINPNVTFVSFPLTMMPPPPHKIVNYNNNKVKQYHPRDSPRQRDNYRPISPKGYDSDESCTSYSSRETPPESRVKPTSLRSTVNRADEQTVVVGKYCHNSPSVYHSSNVHYQVQHNHSTHNSNGHYNKNRYYTNSNNNNHNSNSNGRQKYNSHSKNNMDTMIKRAHGLVERFKSRAEMLKIEPNPPGLSSGGPWDQLNQEIWDLFNNRAQKEKTYDMKINLWKDLFLYIRKCLSSYGLFMVGSTMSGFGLESSDIDMCLLTKPFANDPRLDSLHHLDAIRELLVKNVLSALGPVLNITNVKREHMGPYLCIATNGIPPSVSKRIKLVVQFAPSVWIQYQLIGAYDDQQVTLECFSQAFPKSINYWTKDTGEIIPHSNKFVPEIIEDGFKVHMKLRINLLEPKDYGVYKCISKNSLGDMEGTINVYRIPNPNQYLHTNKKQQAYEENISFGDSKYKYNDADVKKSRNETSRRISLEGAIDLQSYHSTNSAHPVSPKHSLETLFLTIIVSILRYSRIVSTNQHIDFSIS